MRAIDDFWLCQKKICSRRVRVKTPEPQQVLIEAAHLEGGGYRVGYTVGDHCFELYGSPRCERDARRMVRGLAMRLKSGREVVEGSRILWAA